MLNSLNRKCTQFIYCVCDLKQNQNDRKLCKNVRRKEQQLTQVLEYETLIFLINKFCYRKDLILAH